MGVGWGKGAIKLIYANWMLCLSGKLKPTHSLSFHRLLISLLMITQVNTQKQINREVLQPADPF